jgi:tetratricopeptide (TPR) repeat protein
MSKTSSLESNYWLFPLRKMVGYPQKASPKMVIFLCTISIFLWGNPLFSQKKGTKDPLANTAAGEVIKGSEEDVAQENMMIEAATQKILFNLDKSIKLYLDVLNRFPKQHVAFFELSRIYAAQKKYPDALKTIDQALALEKNNAWYWQQSASVNEALARNKEAAVSWEKVVSLMPEISDFYFEWVQALEKSGDFKGGIKALNALEKQHSPNIDITYNKTILYRKIGDQKNANLEWEKLIAFQPNDIETLERAAGYYTEFGMPDRAQELYNKILVLDPNNEVALFILSRNQAQTSGQSPLEYLFPVFQKPEISIDGKLQEFIGVITKLKSAGTNSPLAKDALALCEILQKVHPDQAKTWAVSGDVEYQLNNLEKAAGYYEKAIQVNPGVPFNIWEQLLAIRLEQGNAEKALESSRKAMDVFPNSAYAYFVEATALKQLKEPIKAIASAKQGVMMAGKNINLKTDLLRLQGDIFYSQKDLVQGEKAYSAALTLSPKDPYLLANYCQLMARKGGDLSSVLPQGKWLAELGNREPRFYDAYAVLLMRNGDLKNSRVWLEKALAISTNPPGYLEEHYADLLYLEGKKQEAVLLWDKVFSAKTGSPWLEDKVKNKKLDWEG